MKNYFKFLTATLALMVVLLVPQIGWGQSRSYSYSKTYGYSDLKSLMPTGGNWEDANSYIKIPASSGDSESFTIPIDSDKQPSDNITLTFRLATYGGGTNPSSSGTTITAVGTEASTTWSGSGVSSYPSSSTYVNGTMTITKSSNPTVLAGLDITIGVNTGYKLFRLQSLSISYQYENASPTCTVSPTSWDFGNVQAGSATQTKQFTVTTANLTNDLSVEVLDGTYYSTNVSSIASTATSTTVTVTLDPAIVGEMDDYLIISGDDFSEDIYVELTATGLCNAPSTALGYATPVNLDWSGSDVSTTLLPTTGTGNGGTITYALKTGDSEHGILVDNDFMADAPGTYVVTATQADNGITCGGTFDITINVNNILPICTIEPETYEFGTVLVDATKTTTFTVTTANLASDLTVSIDNTDKGFSVSPTSIPQDATSTTLTVTYAPTEVTTSEVVATLSISGGGLSSDVEALVSGEASSGNTITFNSGNGTCATPSVTNLSGTTFNLPVATPSAMCVDAGWTFVGWARESVSETSTAPTLLTGTYTIDVDATLYAVYKQGDAGFDNTAGGEFAIYAMVGEDRYYATGTGSKIESTTTESEATLYTFEKRNGYGDGEFAIKTGDDYITYGSSTNLGTSSSPYKWTISEGTRGTWRVTSGTSGRALVFRAGTTNKFGGYATSNITTTSEYYDLEIGSATASVTYATSPSCLEKVATPTFTPAEGTYNTIQSVELGCETDGADIYYTTDGTTPTTSSNLYTEAISVAATTTIKAIAAKTGMDNSEVASATYTIVTFSVTYDGNGATDGDVPNDENAYYSGDLVTVLGNTGNLEKTDYIFAGWNTADDGTGTTYAAGGTFAITENTTLYAKWETDPCSSQYGTIYFGNVGTNINDANDTGNDNLGNTWTITTVGTTSFTQSTEYSQVGSSNKPATSITFTTTLSGSRTITDFSAKFGGFSNTAGDVVLKVGETTVGTGSLNGTNDVVVEMPSDFTPTPQGTVLTVTVTNIAKGVKCYNLSYSTKQQATVTAEAGTGIASVQINGGATGLTESLTEDLCNDVTFKATLESDEYHFLGWFDESNNIVSSSLNYTFTVAEDVTYTAKASNQTHLWTDVVIEQPGTDSWEVVNDTILIKDEQGLAWFVSYVNGFNNSDAHPYANAKLCANVNMNGHVWVPIGYNTMHEFKGFFDGQCYFIDSIHIANDTEYGYVESAHGNLERIGLFGYVDGIDVVAEEKNACIRNTFVTSGNLYSNHSFAYIGSVVGSANETTMEFCEGAATINAANGISVGSVCGSIIHDSYVKGCMGMSTIQSSATNTGGIAGALSDVSVGSFKVSYMEHSFANSNITTSTSSLYKTGAVVGHFYGNGWADPVYVHPDASGAANILGENKIDVLVDETARGYVFNSGMNYQYVNREFLPDITIPSRGVYTTVSPVTYIDHDNGNTVTIGSEEKRLCEELNSYGTFKDGTTMEGLGLHWDRVYGITAINGDYPILYPQNKIDGRVMAVAQRTGEKALRYGSVDDLITSCNANAEGGTVYMYQNDTIRVATNDNVVVYVNENVALYQTAAKVNAVVAVTLDNSAGNGEMSRDWHMFSASIAAGKTGLNYIAEPATYPASGNDLTFGEHYSLIQNDDAVYFPNGITTANGCNGSEFDIYSFYEEQYHWMNLKRNNHHWHQDNQDPIEYTSEKTFIPGKGYLIALGDNGEHNNNLIQAKGVLNNDEVETKVTNKGEHLNGYNLLGNPYQSYLDFDAFANLQGNTDALWANDDTICYKAYLIYDADVKAFKEHLVDGQGNSFSQNAENVAGPYLSPHQGFFVVKNSGDVETDNEATVRFTNAMRVTTPNMAQFRDEQPSYPLVNLSCTDSDGKCEHSVIEIDRPLNAGSLKMKGMLNGKANMYIHWNNTDYGSVFIDHTPDYVPVWFETSENGVFTMTWNTANADFGYMHLIDNLAGVDYDCLANDSYTFEARVNDMASRFRLVFKPLGIEEETTEKDENFAFLNGEQLIVNGSGDMQLIDVNGRIIMTEHLSGEQNSISLPNVAAGVYMLRMTNTNRTKIQKIMIRR